ncbi:MAG: MCP four helix bundle domain-containing protein [Clostridia bacterium]|nr:MCP four helix bundle domain-containing protein [Clostridia bacterium]
MKNLKVGKKLWISYIIILVFLAASMAMSIFQLMNMGAKVETFYNGPFTVKGAANTMNTNFEAMQKSVYRAIANTDSAITAEAMENAKKASSNVQEQFAIVKEIFPGDPQIIANLEKHLAELAPHREHVLELASQNKNTEAAEYMENHNIAIIKNAQNELNSIIEFANNRGGDFDWGSSQYPDPGDCNFYNHSHSQHCHLYRFGHVHYKKHYHTT